MDTILLPSSVRGLVLFYFCFKRCSFKPSPSDLGLPFPRGAPQSPALQPLQAGGRFRARSNHRWSQVKWKCCVGYTSARVLAGQILQVSGEVVDDL